MVTWKGIDEDYVELVNWYCENATNETNIVPELVEADDDYYDRLIKQQMMMT